MPIDIRIQIDLSPRQKRVIRAAVVAGAVIGALGLGVAIAAPKNIFKPTEVLSSQKMNDNFTDLDTRLASLEKLRIGTLKGTAGPTTGSITAPGNLVGYQAARALCQTALNNSPTAHMCDASEMVRSAQLGIPNPGGVSNMWFASGIYSHPADEIIVDCSGYTTTGASGRVWTGVTGSSYGCVASWPIACCD